MARNTVIGKTVLAEDKGVGLPRAVSRQPSAVSLWRSALRASSENLFLKERGFTFIEMVMVCVMIAILVGIAIPAYQSQVLASKEAVLKNNLATLRDRLDQFKADRGVYPTLLDELVEKGYLRELPEDPMTGEHTWEEIYEEFDPDQPEEELGVWDVRSFSADIGTVGTPYNEW